MNLRNSIVRVSSNLTIRNQEMNQGGLFREGSITPAGRAICSVHVCSCVGIAFSISARLPSYICVPNRGNWATTSERGHHTHVRKCRTVKNKNNYTGVSRHATFSPAERRAGSTSFLVSVWNLFSKQYSFDER